MLIDILEPMGVQFDRLRCEVCQNLFLSPMNTGFLDTLLQQCLPFTVLKLKSLKQECRHYVRCNSAYRLRY